ncbi:MAG: nucleotide exchange factor GrpE [Azoarcus sp.]|jgi:molecular chaperone GrpE|nr:nucleotide exchange factor GrpE [Azoarcus sp.]
MQDAHRPNPSDTTVPENVVVPAGNVPAQPEAGCDRTAQASGPVPQAAAVDVPPSGEPQNVQSVQDVQSAQSAQSAQSVQSVQSVQSAQIDFAAALTEARALAAGQREAWLRAKAETENVRRRAQDDIAKAAKFAAERFASAMLPVKDSLEAALAIENQSLEKLREGVELTLRQLVAAFDGARLVEENPLGQKFDPNKHQAIGAAESEAEPNTVIDVLQKGYLLHDRVIRPAMVMVAKAKT